MFRVTIITGTLLVIVLLVFIAQSSSNWSAALNLPFTDIDSSTLEGNATLYLAHRGFVQGFPDGTFRGSSIVNRAEAAKLLVLAAGIPLNEDLPNPFVDISRSEWFTPFVVAAREEGILDGYTDGSFRPARGITTAEFTKMAVNAFELPLSLPHRFTDFHAGSWFTPFAGAAWHYHLFPEHLNTNILLPEELLSRNDIVIAIYQIATFGTKAHFINPAWNLQQDHIDMLRSRGQFHVGGKSLPTPHFTGGILPDTEGVVLGK